MTFGGCWNCHVFISKFNAMNLNLGPLNLYSGALQTELTGACIQTSLTITFLDLCLEDHPTVFPWQELTVTYNLLEPTTPGLLPHPVSAPLHPFSGKPHGESGTVYLCLQCHGQLFLWPCDSLKLKAWILIFTLAEIILLSLENTIGESWSQFCAHLSQYLIIILFHPFPRKKL